MIHEKLCKPKSKLIIGEKTSKFRWEIFREIVLESMINGKNPIEYSITYSYIHLINFIGFPERLSLINAFVCFQASLGTSRMAFSDKSNSTKLVNR